MKRALLLSLACLVPVLALCSAAPAWAFLSTGDGAWVRQNPLPQGNQLNGVAFADPTHGWAAGGDTILATSDGGATWKKQSLGVQAWLAAVAFPDAAHGWAVGGEGTILATSDGGAHWKKQRSRARRLGSPPSPSLTPPTAGRWERRSGTSSPPPTAAPTGRSRSSGTRHAPRRRLPRRFPRLGGGPTGVRATHPRHHQRRRHLEEAAELAARRLASLYGVSFPDAAHGWAVGDAGTILATTDGGAHWKAQRSGTTLPLSPFPSSTTPMAGQWATTWSWVDVILATTNGGATWTTQSSGATAYLYGVAFGDDSHGWAVGDGGTMLTTADGGAHWNA